MDIKRRLAGRTVTQTVKEFGSASRGGFIGLRGRIYRTKYKLEFVVVFGKDFN